MTDYRPVWAAVWQFQKRYLVRLPTELHSDAFWQELIDEADKTAQQCGNTRFARDLVMACMNEFEQLATELRQRAKNGTGDIGVD